MTIILKKNSLATNTVEGDLNVIGDIDCDNINISGTITTPGGGSYVTTNTAQTITGLKKFSSNTLFGDPAQTATSPIHLFNTNSTLTIETTAGGTSTLLMKGQTKDIIDFDGINTQIETDSGRYLDINNAGTQYFRYDNVLKTFAIGDGATPIQNIALNISGANGKVMRIPEITTAQEGPIDSSIDGQLWYNNINHEPSMLINGTVQRLVHKNTLHTSHTYDAIPPPPQTEAKIYYNQNSKRLEYYTDKSIPLKLSNDVTLRAYNNTGSLISKFTPVIISGVNGNIITIAPALASNLTQSKVVGVVMEDVANLAYTNIMQHGILENVNTSAFSPNDILYLSDSVLGGYQNTVVSGSTSYNIQLGFVMTSDATTGKVLISLNADLHGLSGESSRIVQPLRKSTSGTLNKGELIYIVGYSTSGNCITAELADNTDPVKIAFAMVLTPATNNTTGSCVVHGNVDGLVTNSFNPGDALYLTTAGNFSNTRPTGSITVQQVAVCVRSNPTNGIIEMIGGHAEDLPNLTAQNHIFIANVNSQPVSTLNNTVNVDLVSTQTNITGTKTFTTNTPGALSKTILENTYYDGGINGADIGIEFKCTNVFNRRKSIYLDGNGTSVTGTGENGCIAFYDHNNTRSYCCIQGNINENYINLPITGSQYRAEGFNVLTKTTLGPTVLNSSLTSVGILNGVNVNGANTYQLAGDDVITATKLRLNNVDIINQSTATLENSIINAKLQFNSPSSGVFNIQQSNLVLGSPTGLDCSFAMIRSTGEDFRLLTKTTGFTIRNNSASLDYILLNTSGCDLVQSGQSYRVGGINVLGSRKTGWGAPTGTATRTTFATSTVTTQQLAERVKALIDDLISHGIIGV